MLSFYNKSGDLGIKSLILRVKLAIRRCSKNIDNENCRWQLLGNWGIRTIKNGNLWIFSQRVYYTKTLSSILMARSGFLGQIFLNDIRNSLSFFIAQSSSINVETP